MFPTRYPALLAAGLLATVAACSDQQPIPFGVEDESLGAPVISVPGEIIPGAYIVVLKTSSGEAGISATSADGRAGQLDRDDAAAVAQNAGAEPRQIFRSINGFAADLSSAQLEMVRQDSRVAYVEPDQIVTSAATTQSTSVWGLDRTDQRPLPLSKSYSYNASGKGVYVYVIDSGLQADHPEFEKRARNVYDALGGNGSDCHGHGTHVGGTIGAKTYGVAKKVYLRGVRVADCSASGRLSNLIAGIDWVRKNHADPAVANLSVLAGYSGTLNTAVTNLVNAGVFVSVAGGNNGEDACTLSPASATAAFTAAASDKYDYRVSWSGYGKCIDGYAPGVSVKSTWIGSSTRTKSGTSMAAPHIAGVAALYKSKYGNASSSTIDSWIKNNATAGVIKSNPSGTPNKLVFKSTL